MLCHAQGDIQTARLCGNLAGGCGITQATNFYRCCVDNEAQGWCLLDGLVNRSFLVVSGYRVFDGNEHASGPPRAGHARRAKWDIPLFLEVQANLSARVSGGN